MKREWWFSSPKMTVWVQEENELVTDCAPVVRKFIGQHIKNLADWMRCHSGPDKFEWVKLNPKDS